MSGKEIKRKITEAGVKIWQVAEAFGVADTTFSKYLRRSFSEADTKKVLSIIEKLKAKAKEERAENAGN